MMKIRRRINDDMWTFKIVNSREMKKQREDGDDIAGLCVSTEKTIYIHKDNVNYNVISHELFHAYFSSLHLDDTEALDIYQLEEIMASFFAAKAEVMVKKAKGITRDLQKLQHKENE